MELQSATSEIWKNEGFSESYDGEDLRNSLLWTAHDNTHRGPSRYHYSKSIPSLRLYMWMTGANILLFIISAFMMWTSLGRSHITLQDHWRETS